MTIDDFFFTKYPTWREKNLSDIQAPVKGMIDDFKEYLLQEFLAEKLKNEQRDFIFKKSLNVDEGQE